MKNRLKRLAFLPAAAIFIVFVWIVLVRTYLIPAQFTRQLPARFEWSTTAGFTVFDIPRSTTSRAWSGLIAIQVEPQLNSYLKHSGKQHAHGYVMLTVSRVIPIAIATAMGSDGIVLDPGYTPLMKASSIGDVVRVRELINNSQDVNAKDQDGNTALMIACMRANCSSDLINVLASSHTDLNVRNDGGETALLILIEAASNESELNKSVETLLHWGADPNLADNGGNTPLMEAARRGQYRTLQLLIDSNAVVEAHNVAGETALSIAIKENKTGAVEVLKKHSGAISH